jgi:integrase
MKGNIEQRGDGSWRVRVFVGRENGKTKFASRTITGTKREAQSALAKLVVEVDGGAVAKSHEATVADFLEDWLAKVAPERSTYTMTEYRRLVARNISPAIGATKLDRLTGTQLDGFYAGLLARGLSAASVRRHHSLIHAALRRAVKWGLIPANPADRATAPRAQRSEVSAPKATDVQRLLAAADSCDPTLATAVALAAITGARRGELCALRWSDVDWTRRTISIGRSLTMLGKMASEGPTKTHQVRTLSLDAALGALLVKRRKDQESYASAVGVDLVADPFVLSRTSDGSAPCQPDGLSQQYLRLARSLGITTHLHELRHFSATAGIASGMDVRTVAGRLGHADASVTLRVYAHALEARDRDLGALLGNLVLGPQVGQETGLADHPAPAQVERSG